MDKNDLIFLSICCLALAFIVCVLAIGETYSKAQCLEALKINPTIQCWE